MKTCTSLTAIAMLLCGTAQAAERIEERKSWTENFPLSSASPTLEIANIWGDVRVRPGSNDEIKVTVTEHRSAPDQQRFDRTFETFKIHRTADDAAVVLMVGDPEKRWHFYEHCRDCRVEYRFDVLVPANTRLDVSTVNEGQIDVAGITGMVTAGNVNGPVSVSGLHACKSLSNVNGRVSLSFSKAPISDCSIETVNGDIRLSVPESTGLDINLDLFNGRLKSQFQVDPMAVPATVKHTESNGQHRYRIEQAAGIRIAGGGPKFSMSSLNGDIHIQKTQ